MEGKVIVELIEPLIGKQGQVRLLFRGLNGRWTLNDDKHPLVAVQLRQLPGRPTGIAARWRHA